MSRYVLCASLLLVAILGCRARDLEPNLIWEARVPTAGLSDSGELSDLSRSTGVAAMHPGTDSAGASPVAPEYFSAPLTLEEVIHASLSANPDLEAAAERVAIAQASLDRARSELYPRFTLAEQYAVTNNPANAFTYQLNQRQFSFLSNPVQLGTVDNFHSQLRFEHQLYSGHRRSANQNAAESLRLASIHELEAARNELVCAAAEAYYRLLQARDLAVLANDAVSQVEEHLRSVRMRYEAQTAMRSDVLTMEVRLAEVREAKIAAENRLRLAWAVLRSVTGADIRERELPREVPTSPWCARMESLQQSVDEARHRRPELAGIFSHTDAARHALQAAAANKRPTVDMLASYDLFSGDFSSANDSYFVGLILEWNLFDAGRTASEVERAAAELRELKATQRRLMLDIELDVQRSFWGLLDAQQRLEVAAHAIQRAEQSLHDIEARFRSEMATTTELIDAQLALTEARVRRATAQAELQICAASLERAMGRLCQTLDSQHMRRDPA